jgi:hypothetical protein
MNISLVLTEEQARVVRDVLICYSRTIQDRKHDQMYIKEANGLWYNQVHEVAETLEVIINQQLLTNIGE